MQDVDKIAAARIDGMLEGARETINAIVGPLRALLPPRQQKKYVLKLARAMAELIDVSRAIHDVYPDIDPDKEAHKRGGGPRYIPRTAAAKPKPKRKSRTT